MEATQRSLLLRSSAVFPLPSGFTPSYGTSGFRADASLLPSTVFRAGILAALRALKTRCVTGLVITASHNQVSDNGVKIADPSGHMLAQAWEPFADSLAAAPSPDRVVELVAEFAESEGIEFGGSRLEVLLGRDTRPSGLSLLQAAKLGIESIIGVVAIDVGILTTPQLHWMVRASNRSTKASEFDYLEQLSASFRCLMGLIPSDARSDEGNDKLVVDGANGIGGEKLLVLKEMLNLKGLEIEVRNSGKGGVLNEGVGADFVQKEKVVPSGFGSQDVGIRCASLDGDADRVVYFTVPSATSNKIDLVDGDKILSLYAVFIKEQLSILRKESSAGVANEYTCRIGIVQTAYANGASTDYLKQLGLEVALTPTGVKYLHEKATEYDIGIYFEANGHGTFVFAEPFVLWLEAKNDELSSVAKGSEQQKAVSRLLAVTKLINQAVGDAISGILLVEVILRHMGWSIQRWNELYHDLPSKQLKVKVVDRTTIVTANAETEVVRPPGIQEAINTETAKYNKGRCFVRPSGTEDVVRIYAEASTQDGADSLANSVAKLVDKFLGFGSS